MSDAAARPTFFETVMNPESIFKAIERFGMPLVMLVVILWWAKNDVIVPLLKAHFEVVEQIVHGQKEHSQKLDSIGTKLDELIRIGK